MVLHTGCFRDLHSRLVIFPYHYINPILSNLFHFHTLPTHHHDEEKIVEDQKKITCRGPTYSFHWLSSRYLIHPPNNTRISFVFPSLFRTPGVNVGQGFKTLPQPVPPKN